VQPVEKVGTVPRVNFRRLEPGQTLEIGRGPFPDTSIVAVQRPSTRIHPGVRSPIHEFSKRKIRTQCICMDYVRPRFDLLGDSRDGVPPLDPDVGAQPSRSWSDFGLPQHPQLGLGRDPASFPLGVRRQLFPARHQGPVLGDVHGDGAVQRLDLRCPFRGGGRVP
jgi:hypothetical protein